MGSGPPGELHRYQLGKGAGTASSRSGVKKLSPASLSVFFSIFAVFVVFFSVPGSTPSLGVRRLLVCRPPPRRAPLLGGVPLLPRRGPDPRPLQPAPRPPRRPARRMPRPPPHFPWPNLHARCLACPLRMCRPQPQQPVWPAWDQFPGGTHSIRFGVPKVPKVCSHKVMFSKVHQIVVLLCL